MTGKGIAPHETLELHELLTFKNVCATKAATMVNVVSDNELKTLLQQDFTVAQGQIKELQSLIQTSTFATTGTEGSFKTTEKTSTH